MSQAAELEARIEAELREIRRLVLQSHARLAPVAVSLKGAAEMLGCSAKHVSRMVRRGTLETVDLDGARRIPVWQIHELLRGVKAPESSGAPPERVKHEGRAAREKLRALRAKR